MIRKIRRWFMSFRVETKNPITIIKDPIRFTSWEDAVPYLGKPVVVCLVESPDIKGNLEGIRLAMTGDKILTGFLEVQGHRWEYWKCKPGKRA